MGGDTEIERRDDERLSGDRAGQRLNIKMYLAYSMGETKQLAAFVANTTYNDIPSDSLARSKEAIRDFLGVAIYGSQHEVGEQILSHVEAHQSGGSASVIGHDTASATGAALANGTFGHAIDYDDTFESIVIHPTSPICSAALAAADVVDVTGADLLTGYAVGVETAYRLGHSTDPSHYKNGWHSTGTIGSFGATAASASICGLDEDAIRRALGIVASGSSSLKKNFGSMTKPLHAGHAAEVGLRATLLARDGFTADPDVLEEKLGYGNVMTPDGEYDPSEVTDGLGRDWNVTDIGFKPYPSGVITHAAMDAMRTLVQREDLRPSDVRDVRVALDDAASEMLIHAKPDDALQAKFSIEFCLAAILREGDAGVHEFTDEYVQQPETKRVIDLVEREFEPNLLGGEYAGYGARVTVTTTDGGEYQEEVQYAPGSPNNPLSEERLRQKFFECAETVLTREEAEAAADAVDTLEEAKSLAQLREVVSRS